MYKPYNSERGGGGGGYKGGGRKFGGGGGYKGGGGFDRANREMHDAVCASCGENCKVPFRPNGMKPVYCANCFKKEEGGDDRSERPSYGEKKPYVSTPRAVDTSKIEARLASIEEKLDALIEALTMEEGDEDEDDEDEEGGEEEAKS